MTLDAAKKKLHEIIDHAGEKELFALLSLIEGIEEKSYAYDEATLAMLHERSEQYLTGKAETFTIEESLERIRLHRKQNGI